MSPPLDAAKHQAGMRARLDPLQIYTTAVSLSGLALLIWALIRLPPHLPEALLFIVLVIIAELTTSGVFAPQMTFSMSAAVAFSILFLFGPLPAALGGIAGGITVTCVTEVADRRRGRSRAPLFQRALFNLAAFGLPMALVGALYMLLGGQVGEIARWSNALPMVLSVVFFEFANAGFVVVAVSLQTGKPVIEIWKQNVSWAVPINIVGMLVGGAGLAFGYQLAGLLGVGAFFLPLALIIYAFQLYVRQAKSQMEELERNIAERRRAEERLTASLREKEVLLQEIHHRVKNNLQVMASLLHLQSRYITDPDVLAMFKESRNRIRTMALVHEKLYQSSDLSQISFFQYIRSLSNYLFRSYGIDPNRIRLRLDMENVCLSIDTAIPCGLIVNEMLSNSLLHAFPDDREGEICVELRPLNSERLVLVVRDNGVGFPPATEDSGTGKLGLQLVHTLTDQLAGTLSVNHNHGTEFKVVFSEVTYKH
jgi:two-component sensor histidine kinase